MAFCGVKFWGDHNEEKEWDPCSLKNIYAFSTSRKQHAVVSERSIAREGLQLRGSDLIDDLRTKIKFTNDQFVRTSYYMQCHIVSRMQSKKGGAVGTCSEVLSKDPNVHRYLTCAHNLGQYSTFQKKVVPAKETYIFKARQGEKCYLARIKADHENITVHPKYNNNPDCGYDIGLITAKNTKCLETRKHFHQNKFKFRNHVSNLSHEDFCDVEWAWVEPEEIKVGMDVEVAGFPGEHKAWPFTHTGKVQAITKTTIGGTLLWYNVQTTPGNSGSCIMITDKDFVRKKTDKPGVKKIIVGVHTGHQEADMLNFGTLITPKLGKWVDNMSN